MIVAIHQPQYMPWLGYLDKMDKADVFCFLDNVQFKKNEWQNRNRLRTKEGWQWITVPVFHDFGQKIMDVRINGAIPWGKKHCRMITQYYSRAPFYREFAPVFEDLLGRPWELLSQLNMAVAETLAQNLSITTRLVKASDMELPDSPTERLIGICRELGADTYLAGRDGANYMDLELFRRAEIRVLFQDFRHPEYAQAYPGFVPALSAADLLFCCGPEGMERVRGLNPPLSGSRGQL
ncbi:MAG: WbqC family protein [Thermodesulfobacteriota bacterium]